MTLKPLRCLSRVAAIALAAYFTGCSSTPDPFAEADKNKDGTLSKSEFSIVLLESIYAAGDANGDAKIIWVEWVAADPKAKKSAFTECDTDNDGNVTPAEFKAMTDKKDSFGKLFVAIDTNADGNLSREEAKTFHENLMKAEGETELEKLLNYTRKS